MLNFIDTGMVLSFIFNSIMKSCMGVFSQSFGKYPVKDLKNGRRNWENSRNMTKAVEKHATVCLKLLFLYRLYYCYKSVSNFYGEQSFCMVVYQYFYHWEERSFTICQY